MGKEKIDKIIPGMYEKISFSSILPQNDIWLSLLHLKFNVFSTVSMLSQFFFVEKKLRARNKHTNKK